MDICEIELCENEDLTKDVTLNLLSKIRRYPRYPITYECNIYIPLNPNRVYITSPYRVHNNRIVPVSEYKKNFDDMLNQIRTFEKYVEQLLKNPNVSKDLGIDTSKISLISSIRKNDNFVFQPSKREVKSIHITDVSVIKSYYRSYIKPHIIVFNTYNGVKFKVSWIEYSFAEFVRQ